MTGTELHNLLEESGAILNGHFLLTSGRHSNRYIEKFRVLEKPDALDKVCQLGGYYFKENELAKSLGYDNNERQVGVNAQEVEKILPEVVHIAPISDTEAAKGVEYKTVSYDKLVPLLIESIKDLKAEIDELKKS